MRVKVGVWQQSAVRRRVPAPGSKSHRGDGESGAPLKKGLRLFSVPRTKRREAGFGACKLPGEAADSPGEVRRPWVTAAELTALAVAPHPQPGVGAGSPPAARSWGEGCTYEVILFK